MSLDLFIIVDYVNSNLANALVVLVLLLSVDRYHHALLKVSFGVKVIFVVYQG